MTSTQHTQSPAKSGSRQFIVTVDGCSAQEAEQVINERIGPDEDYGFEYGISWTDRVIRPKIGSGSRPDRDGHVWDNTVPRELASVLRDRDDEQSLQAARWLAEHENEDQVWNLIGRFLDDITELASSEN